MFSAEQAAIHPVGTFELGVIQAANPDLDLGWFYMPGETKDQQKSINMGLIMGCGINAKLKGDDAKLKAAYTYLNWLADVKASEPFTNLAAGIRDHAYWIINPRVGRQRRHAHADFARKPGSFDRRGFHGPFDDPADPRLPDARIHRRG